MAGEADARASIWRSIVRCVLSPGAVGMSPGVVERVQTGVRLEERMLKVLKAIREIKRNYKLDLDARAGHSLVKKDARS